MSLTVPDGIYSPSDLASLILEIKAYAKWFGQYINAQRVGSRLTTEQPELTIVASDLIRSFAKLTPMTVARLDELVAALEKISTDAPVITITLAAPAPIEVKRQLTDWCRREISPAILVAFKFNAHILGGMVVRAGSSVYDWSFRTQLMNTRTGFSEVLNHV